jgi:amidophosphoribosyltransferase
LVAARSYSGNNVVPLIVLALRALQHRGQEAWGIAIPGRKPFRRRGLVSEYPVNVAKVVTNYRSDVAIGHVRYSTVGPISLENAQPVDIASAFCIAHNGTISNADEIANFVQDEFGISSSASDTTIAGYRLLQHLRKEKSDWFSAFEKLGRELDGAYCFIFITRSGEIYAARDDKGFRPLCLGYHEESDSYIICSESVALSVLSAKFIRDVMPGEIIRLGKDGIQSCLFSQRERHSHCAFEYTYFAHPSSIIEGISVYNARKELGKVLAEMYDVKGDIVIPVPDSARPAALGFSEKTGIPTEEGLMKDRYGRKGGLRSFIQPLQSERIEVNKWVVPVEHAVKGKNVVIIDDSIVRGTSSSMMVKLLRKVGAKRITLLVTYPPITHPCFMGIDFPTHNELIVNRVAKDAENLDEINWKVARTIGVDYLGYNSVDGLYKGIGLGKNELCTTCATGDYSCLRAKPEYTLRMRKV